MEGERTGKIRHLDEWFLNFNPAKDFLGWTNKYKEETPFVYCLFPGLFLFSGY